MRRSVSGGRPSCRASRRFCALRACRCRAPVPSEDSGRPEARASAADAAAASRARTASSARGAPRSASTSSGRTRRPCSGGRRSSSGCRPSRLPDSACGCSPASGRRRRPRASETPARMSARSLLSDAMTGIAGRAAAIRAAAKRTFLLLSICGLLSSTVAAQIRPF